MHCRVSSQATSVPLLKIFTNFQVWNVTIAFTIGLWNLYSSTIAMPQFMKTFMDFDLSEVRNIEVNTGESGVKLASESSS